MKPALEGSVAARPEVPPEKDSLVKVSPPNPESVLCPYVCELRFAPAGTDPYHEATCDKSVECRDLLCQNHRVPLWDDKDASAKAQPIDL